MTQAFNLAQFANNLNASGQAAAGTSLTGTVPVANGGTGAATLAANNVLLGNGTSAVQVIAPSTTGNVLQSNGTTWVSAAIPVAQLVISRTLASGTTYTAPTGLKALRVFVLGATGGQSSGAARGGNGGAGYSEKYYSSPAATYTYAIGAGGTTSGTAGGTSTFGVISVTGSGGVTSATGSSGGVGSGGDFNATGGTGGNGASNGASNNAGGGGGASGSRAGNGFAGGNAVVSTFSASSGGGGGTGGAGSGITPGIAKTTLSATAIANWDISAPFSFLAGSSGVFDDTSPFAPNGGNGANCNETTGYTYVEYVSNGGGAGGSGAIATKTGSNAMIFVWEYF